jgi:phage repressor protein C with HTH and peptisase S24 domain
VARQQLTHAQIWNALDRLAARAGLSASGLAKKAELDPTTFNKSKRITPKGRPRWPSTESVAKSLAATNTSVTTFVGLLSESGKAARQSVPLIGFAQAGDSGYFDAGGRPAGKGWDEISLPQVSDDCAYALKVSGDSMKPVYRAGDIIVVSPAAAIRKGDRVVLKTRRGELMVRELRKKSAKSVELKALSSSQADRTLQMNDVDWIARIVWATQ